jgi:predicted nucleic acid-binding protein
VNQLRIFFDANELIRLALAFHSDDAPTQVSLDRLEVSGDPISVTFIVAAQAQMVNGQTIALCSSVRTLKLARAKLADSYRWEPVLLDEFTRLVLRVVSISGGSVLRETVSPLNYGHLSDLEDAHRLGEAARCGAEMFITEDREILDCWAVDVTLRPIAISARSFVDRLRQSKRPGL